jgi:peptidoglycan/xylan/chitin deacetylase (PgdA/CDA1 family)
MNAKPYILMYHAVDEATDLQADPYQICVSPDRLDRQFRWLARRGLRGVSVRELLAAQDRRGLVGLTFDDGYADFHTKAIPVLFRHGFTASVYVVVNRIGARNDWEEGGPVRPLMDEAQVRACVAAGMEVGSHGLNHLHLTGAEPAVLAAEITESRRRLSELLGSPVEGYCYAYGDLDTPAVAAVREAGYNYGAAIWHSPDTGRHALPRTYIGRRDVAWRMHAKRIRARLRGGPISLSPMPANEAMAR